MQEKFITIDGNKIRYLESGDSEESIVLIHGLGASAERWEFVIPYLEKNYRMIVPDLIGFGRSDKPMVDYTPDFFSEFISKFLKKINISKTHLIGASLGGQISIEFASKHKDVVKKTYSMFSIGYNETFYSSIRSIRDGCIIPNNHWC